MNYSIIKDLNVLEQFIDWLPELEENECFYMCLFARNKYVRDTPEYFAHIKSDKAQIKRFLVSRKKDFVSKIRQLEVEFGAYTTKENYPVPQQSLALYINPNPRNQVKATYTLMKKLLEILEAKGKNFNINAESLSAIQKSPSRKYYFDFDIDIDDKINLLAYLNIINTALNSEAINILETRGGIHLLVELSKIHKDYKNNWYKNITSWLNIDLKGDNMIPVPGCVQGDFVPKFINK